MLLIVVLMTILAYLIGSISSAILVCKLLNLSDPRTTGSKNPGATNVLRLSNKFVAAIVLVFDILKGTIPVWGAFLWGVEPVYLGIIALSVCLGHMFPLFFEFKGGKAVATAFGVLMALGFDMALILIVTWLMVAISSKFSSLAAIVTVSLAPLYTWLLNPLYVYPVLMLSALIIFRHKDNIVRLLKGTESKVSFGQSKETPTDNE